MSRRKGSKEGPEGRKGRKPPAVPGPRTRAKPTAASTATGGARGGTLPPSGAFSRNPEGAAADAGARQQELSELQPLNPVFAWFEGGDRLQFGDLCPTCPPEHFSECQAWRKETLDGIRTERPREDRQCRFYLKWKETDVTREKLTKDELAEGEHNRAGCPKCGGNEMSTSVRTSSEFGGRMNPRALFLRWCKCGHFSAEKKELLGDREHCVFCGSSVREADGTMFKGTYLHIDCLLRLRFFCTMGEMLKVAQGYAITGKTLTMEESSSALKKTLALVRAFKITGNRYLLGVNRVIHWLEGDSPLISVRTICRTREELKAHLEEMFRGEAERSAGVHALEDVYIVYDSPEEVRWITHGAHAPSRSIDEFLRDYLDPAKEGQWAGIEKRELREYKDGVCVICGNISRSHRIASGLDEKNIYVCHHCWTGKKPEKK